VRIDVDQLLAEKEEERKAALAAKYLPKHESSKKSIVKREILDDVLPPAPKTSSRKRKSDISKDNEDTVPKLKKIKIKPSAASKVPSATISIPASKPLPKLSITLKLGPRPAEAEPFPCCLCVSMNREGLLRVHEPPLTRKDAVDAAGSPKVWLAHEDCASIVPETWVDEIDSYGGREKVVFGVDGIVKDRWNLVCSPPRITIDDSHQLIPSPLLLLFLFVVCPSRNVLRVRKPDPRRTARRCSAPRASARRRSM
jgi:hypothetical protein